MNLVDKTPILTTLLLEYANIGQIYRMWHEQSAKGQNVWSWLAVNVALWLWFNYYRIKLPNEHFARWATAVGILINSIVIISTIHFHLEGR
jgi:uncharacterized protein with PQ loop repeat